MKLDPLYLVAALIVVCAVVWVGRLHYQRYARQQEVIKQIVGSEYDDGMIYPIYEEIDEDARRLRT